MASQADKELLTSEDLRNNVVFLLEMKCAGCAAYMQPPIVQCKLGHSICLTCAEKSRKCVRCGKGITRKRNIHLERIANTVKYPCHNAVGGCKSMLTYIDLEKHEESCDCRMFFCQLGFHCQWHGWRNNLSAHVAESHCGEIVMTKSTSLLYKKFKYAHGGFTRLIKAFGEVFWYHHIKSHNAVHWAVQYIGPDINATKFSFDFKIIDSGDSRKYVGFKNVSCLSSSENPDEEFKNSRCVKVHLDVVENFTNSEGNIKCFIEIKKFKAKNG